MEYGLEAGGGEIRLVSLDEWATAVESRHAGGEDAWRVAADAIGEDMWVSTVFLGMNHAFGAGPDLWYETMVFARETWAEIDQACLRWSTRGAAVDGHTLVVAKLNEWMMAKLEGRPVALPEIG
jgi:hypothetical protein